MEEPGHIKKLDEVVINRIAAGEVIQRPANALKEMIENSLDAKSTNIQVTVRNGGLKLLQIQDNGTGIRREDFEIVCERFTTSKLREFEDLHSIATYGFRGEALASISHVAHLTIVSKTADAKCAFRGCYEDGNLREAVRPMAGNRGTQIIVEDLFYNMNVRRTALRSPAEEYQKISDVVGKYAVHNSKTGFCLKKHGETNDIRTTANSTAVDNIGTIYGSAIARELIEFACENAQYKFKAYGQMTNVNYSTKKMQFILFINHRLVECQSLRRCIDQIYTTYLPKNGHPFVYLSLEVEPKNIDVNVHPTKHEVHFLNEEQIVEAVAAAVETKLLGSNNSRVFYVQSKLPGTANLNVSISERDKTMNKTVYDKDLVRTDSSEQKLEKFFGPATGSKDEEGELAQQNEDFLRSNESFEDKLLNQSVAASPKRKFKVPDFTFKTDREHVPVRLKSVLAMQTAIEKECDDALREIFSSHVFVGAISPKQSLIQQGTRLYLCDSNKIMQELFYQFLVFNFQNFDAFSFDVPLSLEELVKIGLDLEEAGWTPEDGDKVGLAQQVTEILTAKRKMLHEYFSLEIDADGLLRSIPILIDKHIPDRSGLPMYMLRLATEVNWDEEMACFETFSRETAKFYAQMGSDDDWQHVTEHILYPTIKDYFSPKAEFKTNGAILQIADLPNLYKVFERC